MYAPTESLEHLDISRCGAPVVSVVEEDRAGDARCDASDIEREDARVGVDGWMRGRGRME